VLAVEGGKRNDHAVAPKQADVERVCRRGGLDDGHSEQPGKRGEESHGASIRN